MEELHIDALIEQHLLGFLQSSEYVPDTVDANFYAANTS